MRIIVMSDSHGSASRVRHIFEGEPGAELYLHLGDGAADFVKAGWLFPSTARMGVLGNCDFSRDLDLPKTGLVELGGKRIFFTHGDLYRVKYGLDELEDAAREKGADIALFGHTHTACQEYRDGLWLLNPGSALDSSHTPAGYLALDITEAGVVPVFKKL